MGCTPHHRALRGASPRGEALIRGSLENRRTLKFQTVCNSPLRGTRRVLIHYYVFQGGVFGKRGTAQFFPVEAAFERFVAQLFRFEYHLRAVF